MHSILHRVVIEASPEALYQAVAEQSGVAAWWSKCEIANEQLSVFFGPSDDEMRVDFAILSAQPNEELSWQCSAGPWQEKGAFVFTISADERGSCLHFAHHGWEETDDFYQHCNAKWGFFLLSLKQYLETGAGMPHPNDPNI